MKITHLILFGILFMFQNSFSQSIITVQSGINVYQYNSFDSAMAYAINGDQIYLPGGVFTSGNFIVNKSVEIFGAGHYPDSTLATGITNLIGDVNLVNGSSGGLLTGCYISGNIKVGSGVPGTDSVSNFSISRCNFNNLYLSSTGLPPTNAHIFSVSENIIRGSIMGANAQSINISQNIIQGGVGYFSGNATFNNNDFIGLGNCPVLISFLNLVSSSTFVNNIFLFSPPACTGAAFFGDTCNLNVFTNNLFKSAITFPNGTNNGYNSITNQTVSSIFLTATGDVFYYSQDYHLKTTSLGYHAATDGYDVGVYGTLQPYKTDAVPFNPHIQQKAISTSTNPQGQLNIQINVAGQDH
jgi:hypothetical protein